MPVLQNNGSATPRTVNFNSSWRMAALKPPWGGPSMMVFFENIDYVPVTGRYFHSVVIEGREDTL